MNIVWIVFVVTALLVVSLARVCFRASGPMAPVLRELGRYLLILAAGTAFYPVLLPFAGVPVWVAGYLAFVAIMTGIILTTARRRAQC